MQWTYDNDCSDDGAINDEASSEDNNATLNDDDNSINGITVQRRQEILMI